MKFRSMFNGKWVSTAGLTAVLFLAAACGGDDVSTDAGIASLNDGADQVDTAPVDTALEAPENPEDAFALFGQCMTDAGFDFGDTAGASGLIQIAPNAAVSGDDDANPQDQSGSFEDFDPEAFDEANEACEGHLANVDSGFDMTPEQQAAFEDAQLEMSECMEEQGFAIPELASAGDGGTILIEDAAEVDNPQSGSSSVNDLDFDFEGFEEAAEMCQSVFDGLDGQFTEVVVSE